MFSRNLLFLWLLGAWGFTALASDNPKPSTAQEASTTSNSPMVAPIEPVTDTYFGESVTDPYRWQEQVDTPQTQEWMHNQANYANAVLQQVPERAKLIELLQRLPELPSYNNTCIHETAAGSVFFLREGKLFVRTKLAGSEHLLLDPATLNNSAWLDGQKRTIDYLFPSPEGNLVAVGIGAGGSEKSVLYILSASRGTIIDGPIDRSYFSFRNVAWLPGEKKLLIRRFPELPSDAPATERMLNSQVWLHQLGTNTEHDVLVFGSQYKQELAFQPQDWAVAYTTPSSPYVLGIKARVSPALEIYFMPRQDLGKTGAVWRKLFEYDDQVVDFALRGNILYVLSRKNAQNGRVLRMALAKSGNLKSAVEFLPETTQLIDLLGGARDALYLKTRNGVYEQLLQVSYSGAPSRLLPLSDEGSIALPNRCGTSSLFGLLASPEIKGAQMLFGSWLKPYQLYQWQTTQNRWQETSLLKPPTLNLQNYQVTNLKVHSHDGVSVPLSLVRSRSLPRNSPQPLLLTAYGGYGAPNLPRLKASNLVWLEQGFTLATCHVRGGGEYGEAWRLAGYQETKANTWKDLIACAEYLIEHQYTSADQLVGHGGSAGGKAISNALVERPELFRAAIIDVGIVDPLRAVVASANGPNHIIEDGDPRTLSGFRALRDTSAYLKIKDGTSYPAVLLMYGVNDSRVAVWQGSKMAARLQAASTSAAEKPILLRLDYGGGHFLNDAEAEADRIAFALWQTRASK